jgi:hypothetical protein
VLGVGAPTSYANVGYVYIYNKSLNSQSFERGQIITGNIGDLFGTSLAFNQNGDWLYIGAPGNNRMYAYGLNRFISYQKQITSINNKNILYFSGNVSASVGDIVVQPVTGARAIVLAGGANVGNLQVDTLTNFYFASNIIVGNTTVYANVFITSGAYTNDAKVYPLLNSSTSVTNSIDLNFVPDVPTDPNSLLITNSTKTFIANVDYVIGGNTASGYKVNFISGNIDQSDYAILQQPYYQLVDTLPIPATISNVTGADYGFALSSSFGGEQVAVGAPKDTVNVGIFATTTTNNIQCEYKNR